jgi:hypothetical protein
MKQRPTVEVGGRMKALEAERNRKMALSAHAYVRGSAQRFYQWLQEPNYPPSPKGPPVWICGDCHAGNLGPVASTVKQRPIVSREQRPKISSWSGGFQLFLALFEAVGVVSGFQDVAVVGDAIQQRRGHFGISKHRSPFTK